MESGEVKLFCIDLSKYSWRSFSPNTWIYDTILSVKYLTEQEGKLVCIEQELF